MISDKVLPAHILRLYILELLEQEDALTPIGGLAPIVPVEDEPKVADKGQAYAIYGYAENDIRGIEQIHEGVFSLRVIAPSFAQLGRITNIVSLAFESSDVATEAVNNFSSSYANGALVGIRFTYTKSTYIEGGEAPENEGGPMDGVVNISYRYISNLPTPILDSARGGMWS